MSLPQTLGFCALLVGVIGYGAKLSVECEPFDVMSLIGMSLAVGYMGNML